MASSIALLLLIMAAVTFTTAQLHERKPLVEHVEPASPTTSEWELLLAAVAALTAEPHELREPLVVEAASSSTNSSAVEPSRRTYVVELEPPGGGEGEAAEAEAARAWHLTFLPSATSLLYSYRTVFTGFAARLTEKEHDELCAKPKPGVVRCFDDIIYTADTTHTPPPALCAPSTSASLVDMPNHILESPDNWPSAGGYVFD